MCISGKQICPGLSSLICEIGIILILLHKVAGRSQWKNKDKVFGTEPGSVNVRHHGSSLPSNSPGQLGARPRSLFSDEDLMPKVTGCHMEHGERWPPDPWPVPSLSIWSQ